MREDQRTEQQKHTEMLRATIALMEDKIESIELKWTTEPPTVPGWYWLKEFRDSVPLIFEYREPEDLSCYAFVSVFAGPLPEPEEA